MWRFTISFPPGASVKVCTTLLWLTEGRVHCEGDGVCTCCSDLLWKSPLHHRHLTRTNCWTLEHWMLGGLVAGVTPLGVFKTSLVLREAVARGPASLLSLSHTSSDIRFGYRNRALLAGALMTDCWLRNEYSVRLITQLEQAVMKWKTILFQLFFGSIFYRPACCLFLYIKRTLKF